MSGYELPGVIVNSPASLALADHMYSENTGRKQDMHQCTHYRVQRQLPRIWWDGWRFWYNVSNKTIPNPGYWTGSKLSASSVWEAFGASALPLGATPLSLLGPLDGPLLGLPVLAVPIPYYPDRVSLTLLSEDERNILLQDALNAMLPGIKSRLSLPNTLFELKDMKTLSRSVDRIQAAMGAFKLPQVVRVLKVAGLKGLFSLRKGSTLRVAFQGAADGYLQHAFNLQPLLKDLLDLQKVLRSLRQDLESLRRQANRTQVRHYARDLVKYSNETTTIVVPFATTMVDPSMTVNRIVRYPIRRFCATMRYSYSLPSYSDAEFGIRGLLDGLGVNLNPSIIWNAIPWSFVVDWFLGVSRWLSQFQVKNIEPVVHVSGFCHSVHVRRNIITSASYGSTTGQVLDLTEDAYERVVGLNQSLWTSSFRMSGMNLKEFTLSAALALSR
jgi:hypothetical protein